MRRINSSRREREVRSAGRDAGMGEVDGWGFVSWLES